MTVYNFTGNPFVDTGLGVLVAKAREAGWGGETIQDLTSDTLEQAIGDGKWLAKTNRRLKAFSMVVGNNSPLTNTSSNPSLRKQNRGRLDPEDDRGFQEYIAIVQGLVNEAITPLCDAGNLCESCGMRPQTQVLAAYGKEIGRDWFPLAGSLGSDAQALPASSRALKTCSLCLLAIQLLPLGVMLLHGKLACFQSTSWEMTQLLIEDIYRETQAMLAATASNEKLAALGAKGGTTPTAIRLLRLFENLQINKRMMELPALVTMNVWLFSNSGTGADCDMIEIPNNGLVFLWEAARRFRAEVEALLRRESKKPDDQLLECIRQQRDYDLLYPTKGKGPASQALFAFYQTQVLESPPQALHVAEKVACVLRQGLQHQAEQERASSTKPSKGRVRQTPTEKLLQQMTARLPFRDATLERNAVRRALTNAAEDGLRKVDTDRDIYEMTDNLRKVRATKILKALAVLRGGAKQAAFATEVAPKVIILAGLSCGNLIFNDLFEDTKEGPRLKLDTLQEVITDYADRIVTSVYIGIRTGYLHPDSEQALRQWAKEQSVKAAQGQQVRMIELLSPIQAVDQLTKVLA